MCSEGEMWGEGGEAERDTAGEGKRDRWGARVRDSGKGERETETRGGKRETEIQGTRARETWMGE